MKEEELNLSDILGLVVLFGWLIFIFWYFMLSSVFGKGTHILLILIMSFFVGHYSNIFHTLNKIKGRIWKN
jgi:hypothetical protein